MVKPADITLTAADKANGWTRESLAEHVAQAQAREYDQLMSRLFPARPKLRIENCFGSGGLHTGQGFDPHDW